MSKKEVGQRIIDDMTARGEKVAVVSAKDLKPFTAVDVGTGDVSAVRVTRDVVFVDLEMSPRDPRLQIADYAQQWFDELSRGIFSRSAPIPQPMYVPSMRDIRRALFGIDEDKPMDPEKYRRTPFTPDTSKYAFMFDEDNYEGNRREREHPRMIPTNEDFLKEISKQVWASVLPKDKTDESV